MAEAEKRIEQLKKKITARETKLNKLLGKISDAKSNVKAIKNEIEDMRFEIKQIELEQLSETLTQNGITTADVAAAIAAGEIRKQPPKSDEDDLNDKEQEAADTYITNSGKEVTDNEAGGSGKALGSA